MATKLKDKVTALANKNGLKITSSSRVVPASQQIRFPYNGDLTKFFGTIGVLVKESKIKISGSFPNYLLTDKTGEVLYYVNNATDSASGKKFGTKELTPDTFGLGGARLTVNECVSKSLKHIKSQYDANIAHDFEMLLKQTLETTTPTVSLKRELNYSTSDLATISKDFGEILAAIWYLKETNASKIFFPSKSNEQLLDFYVEKNNRDQAVSVKSGGGGKVTIQNIIDGVTESGVKADVIQKEYSYQVFQLIEKYNAKEGILEVAKYVNAKGLDTLCKAMNIKKTALTMRAIQDFTNKHTNTQLKGLLSSYHKELGTVMTDTVWERPDKIRFIISPMGEYLWKELNADKKMTQSLTRLANMIAVIQVNCDVTKKKIQFKKNSFKSAKFEFGWAGYTAGNKLGFKMKLND